jgi:formylglycine-generating enzyme required for sulfatase activity
LVIAVVALSTLTASAQQAPDPPICNTNLREWSRISNGADAAAMRDLLARTPNACRELRGQITSRIAALAAARPTPPRPNRTTPAAPTSTRGREFDDCNGEAWCPRMVVIPAGVYMMGSPQGEPGSTGDEWAQRLVNIRSFAAGKFEVTWDQWQACADRGGCTGNANPDDYGWPRGNRPVFNVSWNDAREYVRWLSAQTRQDYRLLSESEWEYAARAGTTTAYSTGPSITTSQANFDSNATVRTQPVGRYPPNAFGLHDVHGNVSEWVQDCFVYTLTSLPADGSPYETANCTSRMVRGGFFGSHAGDIRSAHRGSLPVEYRSFGSGFRVARNLN